MSYVRRVTEAVEEAKNTSFANAYFNYIMLITKDSKVNI